MNFIHRPHRRTVAHEAGELAPVKVSDQHHAGRINKWIAQRITKGVGSMWCAYAFVALACISLPASIATGSVIILVAWVAQTFLQLVLLSVIIVGQNIQAEASDKRADSTYQDAEAVLHEALEIQRHLAEQDRAFDRIEATVNGNPGEHGSTA